MISPPKVQIRMISKDLKLEVLAYYVCLSRIEGIFLGLYWRIIQIKKFGLHAQVGCHDVMFSYAQLP